MFKVILFLISFPVFSQDLSSMVCRPGYKLDKDFCVKKDHSYFAQLAASGTCPKHHVVYGRYCIKK